jgi:hypothetical protein
MTNKYIEPIITKVVTDLLINKVEAFGSTNQEIIELNQLVLNNTGKELPIVYKEFLEFGGKGIGNLLFGMGFHHQKVMSRMKTIYETLAEDNTFDICQQKGIIPSNALLFGYKESHPNHYIFFLLGNSDNPLVYEWWVGENSYINSELKFTDYLIKGIDYSEKLHQKIPIEYRAILFYVKAKVINIKKRILPPPSFVWKLLLNDLDSFFENTYSMIWNTQEENKHLYSNFKTLFEELITIIIPSIINKEGSSELVIEIRDDLLDIIEYFSYTPTEKSYNTLNTLKNEVLKHLEVSTDTISAETYFKTWQVSELDTNARDKNMRICAKWLRPQLIYYYNQKIKEVRK